MLVVFPSLALKVAAPRRRTPASKIPPRFACTRFTVLQCFFAFRWIWTLPLPGDLPHVPTDRFDLRWVTNGNRKVLADGFALSLWKKTPDCSELAGSVRAESRIS